MTGRADDHEEFLRAALRHADLLHTLALRLAPYQADAADIVQETYLRAYAAWGRRRPDDVGAWLATICLNAGRDERRRHARRSAALQTRHPATARCGVPWRRPRSRWRCWPARPSWCGHGRTAGRRRFRLRLPP